ncbi:MAG: hypothetical protein BWZ08_01384 [candidate division BRC1 bacterium ADurb.BinA292]|nr:MAG: hypothetical protein BWZ08_01384 [candidate division BRC1 bacterium ADurb.BinA292]HOR29012.1 hypothetical protein [Candidatus Sumerlaeota bacterium]
MTIQSISTRSGESSSPDPRALRLTILRYVRDHPRSFASLQTLMENLPELGDPRRVQSALDHLVACGLLQIYGPEDDAVYVALDLALIDQILSIMNEQ